MIRREFVRAHRQVELAAKVEAEAYVVRRHPGRSDSLLVTRMEGLQPPGPIQSEGQMRMQRLELGGRSVADGGRETAAGADNGKSRRRGLSPRRHRAGVDS